MDGWVVTWGCALQPPDQLDDPPLTGAIVRQTVRVSVGGRRARLVLSNEYGEHPLELGAVALARPAGGRAGASAVEPGSSLLLTFGGAGEVTVPPGRRAISDPFEYLIEARTNVAVTMHVRSAAGPLTTHPGSRTTSHVLRMPEGRLPRQAVIRPELPGATSVVHWYLLAALELEAYDRDTATVVCLGDSLTDGRGSITDGNGRWPDLLADRLHASGLTHIGVVNQAAGGDRLLRDGLGIAALHRLDRDVLAGAGVRWLILFIGVNDIGLADPTPDAQQRIGDELLAGYAQVIERARARGIRVYGSTLTPFGGHDYDDPAGLREQTRRRVNAAIRDQAGFDAVIDFDRIVRAPADHRRARRSLHGGDGLHLNPAGCRALAEAVAIDLFTER
jgi:lysophospholipase L1-like esterase